MTDQFPVPASQSPAYPQPLPGPPVGMDPLAPTNAYYAAPVLHSAGSVRPFYFDGGAATYFGTALLAALVTILTVGLAYPFALVLRQRWKAKHTYIEGRRLMFTGTGLGLFGNWVKWLILIIITVGVYSFWVVPRMVKWTVEHQEFDPRS